MKKQPLRHNAAKQKITTIGVLNTDLVVWDFNDDEHITRHIAEQLAKAILISYNMGNFGPNSFGLDEQEDEEF